MGIDALFSPLDLVAIAWFLTATIGYSWYTEHSPASRRSLSAMMDRQREKWLRVLVHRELRIVDTSIVSSLQNGTAFFASTSLLAIGGCFALLQSTEEIFEVLKDLPLVAGSNPVQWDIKIFGLLLLFTYAFFKFGWSFRLWSYASIMIGAIPMPGRADADETEEALQAALLMNQSAARQFNRGLRSFFFSLGFIGWFVGPLVFIGAMTWIVLVLYRRQFSSQSLAAASRNVHDKKP
ncbi:MAG: DUF599 family protein [Pseudomonadota bacterium]